jgi:hypothetical protein
MTKMKKGQHTTPNSGRPFPRDSSDLVSLRIFKQYQHRHYGYIRIFHTVVLNVLTKELVGY